MSKYKDAQVQIKQIGEVLKNGLVNEIIEQAAVEETVISLNR